MEQLQEMCKDPKMASAPQLAQVCAGLSGAAGAGGGAGAGEGGGMGGLLEKVQQNKAEAAAGEAEGVAAGQADSLLPSAGGGPGAAPAAGGAAPQAQRGGGAPNVESRNQSSIPSIGTQFHDLDANRLREQMRRKKRVPKKVPPKKAVPKKKAPEKKVVEKAPPEPEKKPPAAAPVKAPVPVEPVPPAPPTRNLVRADYQNAMSILKNVELFAPYEGSRSLKDVPLAPIRSRGVTSEGVSSEQTPALLFPIYPIVYDPFNIGLPRRPPVPKKRSLMKRLIDFALGRPSPRNASGEIGWYLAFDEPAEGAEFVAGVPRSVYWSGPISLAPLIREAGAAGSVAGRPALVLGEGPDDGSLGETVWQWGLSAR